MSDDPIVQIPQSTADKFAKMMEDPELKAFLEPLLKDGDGDGVPDALNLKGFFLRDGRFSKTAAFAVIGNVLVLVNYALLSWFAGASFDVTWVKGTIPAFDAGAAATILGLLNGTYVANHALKKTGA